MTHHQKTDLIVALDFPRAERALEFVHQLEGLPIIFKVGLELFSSAGPELVRELVHRKNRVFLDLKLHDIPNTVARAARQAAFLHVEMFSIHLSGGSAMVRAVADELSNIPELRPKILGISVLTSFSDVLWAEVTRVLTGHATEVKTSVEGLIEHAPSWGVDGVVCSAHELAMIHRVYPSLYTVIPGVRLEGDAPNDQARIVTPAQARAWGANAVVVGRPITQSPLPREAAETFLEALSAELPIQKPLTP